MIIRGANREFLSGIPAEFSQGIEALLIDDWRHEKRQLETDDAIYVANPNGGGYFRGSVASLDFDLERLNAFVDAFLFACF
jgi:hypothetical protein